jgi:hypothetical protein
MSFFHHSPSKAVLENVRYPLSESDRRSYMYSRRSNNHVLSLSGSVCVCVFRLMEAGGK